MATALTAGALLMTVGTAVAAFGTEPGSPHATGGTAPYAINVGDFNGDGRPDVAPVNGDSANLSLFLRQPGGGFAAESGSPFALDGAPSNAAVLDFDSNGLADLAVGIYGGGIGVDLMIRQPAGGFVKQAVDTAGGVSGITAGDFNGDGLLDLAVTRQDSNQVQVLLRQGATFVPGQSISVAGTPAAITAGDFNGDGRADIAVANKATASVTVLLWSAAAGFAAEPAVPVGTNPAGLVAADFNGDGRGDLAVTNYGSGTVSILLRNAANTGFADEAGSPIAVSANPLGITLGDFDADGRADLAVAANSGAVDILRRNAGGGFTHDPAIAIAGRQNGIAAADFDGDGRADLAVSEITNMTFSALLNPAAAATPTPTATPTPLPPPVAGKTVNGARKSGKVTFRKPGSKKFVTLTGDAQIPVGSVIDTRKGKITITAAQGKGKTASADFFDGLFKLTQTKGSKPATTLALTEKLSCPKAKKASAAAKKKKSRRLWGSGHGRFTTKGSYSAATVRGTKWLVQDTCTSTTTKVASGVVSVRDLVRHKTIIVRKGKRYVAHRKR